MTLVFKFGVPKLQDGAEAAIGQAELAHRYYNQLIAIVRERYEREHQIQEEHVPELAAVRAELRDVNVLIGSKYDAIRGLRKQASTKTAKVVPTKRVNDAALLDELAELKKQREELWSRERKESKKFFDIIEPGQREFDRRANNASPELVEQIAEIGRQLKEAKKTKNNPDVDKLSTALAELKRQKKANAPKTHAKRDANAATWEAMRAEPEWHPAWKAWKALDMDARAEKIAARAACGLPHGTYVATEAAVEQATKTRMKRHKAPEFRSWDGGRKVGWQLQGHATWGDILNGRRSELEIFERSPDRNGKEREYARFRLRLGEMPRTKKEKERWVDLVECVSGTVVLHRKIDPKTRISWIYLVPNRCGNRITYTLQFTADVERERPHGAGDVHIRLRWTSVRGTDGRTETLDVASVNGESFVLSPRIYSGIAVAEALRGACDTIFDPPKGGHGVKSTLGSWFKEHPDLIPQWMREPVKRMHGEALAPLADCIGAIKSRKRVARAATKWIAEVLSEEELKELWATWRRDRDSLSEQHGPEAGDYFVANKSVLDAWLEKRGIADPAVQMAVWLEWWRRKDAHLWQWSCDTDRKSRAHRKEQYRRLAARLARQYDRCILEELDLAKLAKRAAPDQDRDEIHKAAISHRSIASTHELKEALKHAFGKDRFCERSGANKTPGTARKARTPDESSNLALSAAE